MNNEEKVVELELEIKRLKEENDELIIRKITRIRDAISLSLV